MNFGNSILFGSQGMEYVDRGDPSAIDYEVGDLTTDGTWRDLDLSSIVPAGAVAVHVWVYASDNLALQQFKLRKNGNSNEINMLWGFTPAADVPWSGSDEVACDTNRIIEYWFSNTTWSTININIRGWWI